MRTITNVLGDRPTVTVPPTAAVTDAARVMSERHIGAVPVVDGDRLVGIFTERDIMSRVVAQGRDPSATAVREVMSTDLVVADVHDHTDVALRRMQQARVRHLIVLSEGRLAGILSLRDLLAVELDEREEALTLLNAYVHYIPADLARDKSKT